MAKQSKNRVKLKKQYKSIGKLPISALNKISEFMTLKRGSCGMAPLFLLQSPLLQSCLPQLVC
jgi:hypothetical protein